MLIQKRLIISIIVFVICSCKRYNPVNDKIYNVPAKDNLSSETSLQALTDVVEAYPENAENYYKKALLHLMRKEHDNGYKTINEALEKDSTPSKYYLLKAKLCYQLEKEEEAIKAILRLQNKENVNLETLIFSGELFYKQKEYDQAVRTLNQAKELAPQEAKVYYLKGNIALARYDSTNALKNFRVALSKKKEYKQVYYSLSKLYYQYELYQTALRYADRGLNIDRKDDSLNLVKARIFKARRYYKDSAKLYYRKAYEANPKLYEASYNLGKYAFDKGQYKTAKNYFIQTLKYNKKDAYANYYLGVCYKYSRQYKKALEKLKKAMELAPKYFPARDQYWAVKNKINLLKIRAREDSLQKAYYKQLEEQRKLRQQQLEEMRERQNQ